jgi:hypothetical protein
MFHRSNRCIRTAGAAIIIESSEMFPMDLPPHAASGESRAVARVAAEDDRNPSLIGISLKSLCRMNANKKHGTWSPVHSPLPNEHTAGQQQT